MGANGIGRSIGAGFGRFALNRVMAQERCLYDSESRVLDREMPPDDLILAAPEINPPVTIIDVALLTPLRIKHQNQFQNTISFHLLIRAALRRVSSLEQYYGGGEPALDYRGMVRRAEFIHTIESRCRWLDLDRYSNRQKTVMSMGGLTGTIRYKGDLSEFIPVLRYCEKTNLGKQTAFGLGKIAITIEKGP